MPESKPIPVQSRPGIQRDGTLFDSDMHVDGEWVRWHHGRARKILGYRQITEQINKVCRGMNTHPSNNYLVTHLGSEDMLQKMSLDVNTYVPSGVIDRTPTDFVASTRNLWQFDQMFDNVADDFAEGPTNLMAHAAPNMLDIASTTETAVYYGDILGSAILEPIVDGDSAPVLVSGGVVTLNPYFFAFGNDGLLYQSVANLPTDFFGTGSNLSRVTAKKIVRGLPIRGGASNAPAGLLWSLDSLIRVAFVGGSAIFSYDNVSNDSGILAAMSVIEHRGKYYWAGIGSFMVFTGVIQELPNAVNSDFFYNNLNWPYRNKVFAFKIPRYGEIWWAFPKGSSTECNHAVVFNTMEGTWYDTPLPNGGRTAGENPASYRFPLLTGATQNEDDASILWQHELGVDEVSGNPLSALAIRSYYETNDIALIKGGTNRSVRVERFEPDFVQSGDLTVQVTGTANTKSRTVTSAPRTVPAEPDQPYQQSVTFQGDGQRRLLRFRVESNVAGGYYEQGNCIAHIEPGDGTVLGGTN